MKSLVTGHPKGEKEIELHSKTRGNTENNITFIVMSLVIATITWVFTLIFYHLYTKNSGDSSLSSHYSKLMILFSIGALISTFALFFVATRYLNGEDRVLQNDNTYEELNEMAAKDGDDVKSYPLITSFKLLMKSDELNSENDKKENTRDEQTPTDTAKGEAIKKANNTVTKDGDSWSGEVTTPAELEARDSDLQQVEPVNKNTVEGYSGATVISDSFPHDSSENVKGDIVVNGVTYREVSRGENSDLQSGGGVKEPEYNSAVTSTPKETGQVAPLSRKDARIKKQRGGIFSKGKYGK